MAGKYLKARKLAKEMEEKAKKTAEKKKEVEKGLEEAVNLLEMSEDIGTDVSGVEEIIDQGRDLLEEKEFDEAFEKVEEAVEELRKANASMVDELIGSVQNIHDMIGDEAKYEESLKKIENTKELKIWSWRLVSKLVVLNQQKAMDLYLWRTVSIPAAVRL